MLELRVELGSGLALNGPLKPQVEAGYGGYDVANLGTLSMTRLSFKHHDPPEYCC